jgi:hypothetical protein
MKNLILGILMALFITAAQPVKAVENYDLRGTNYEALDLTVEKGPIYSIPIQNRIVLVKDPKGFIERAIRHGMEYIVIKPSEKGEYWELVPVFYNEKSFSVSFKKSDDEEKEVESEDGSFTVKVADFIRYD